LKSLAPVVGIKANL